MRKKISKVAKDLNVGVSTAVEFLKKHGIEVEEGNVNARIDESAEQLLYKEFSKDKDAKTEAEQIINTRREDKRERDEKKQRARAEDRGPRSLEEIRANGPRILGKIDLDNPGGKIKTPEAPKPQETVAPEVKPEPKPEVKVEEAPKPEVKAESQPKPEIKVETKPEPVKEQAPAAVEAKAEAPVKAAPVEEVKVQTPPAPKPATPEAAVKQAPAPEQKAEGEVKSANEGKTADEEKPASDEPFRLSAPATPGLKVVGKIDLSAINSATRPKKKSRADRKRKRIGKEKVDVEKAAQQPGFGSDQRRQQSHQDQPRLQGQGQGGGRRRRGGQGGNRPVGKPEVSNEDVQKQVKETLARLTNKTTKKSVKFRKEKREEMHNREVASAQREAAESKVLKITEFVTANDLASLMDVPVNQVIATCMNLGVMVSINQRLDAETINIVAEEFGFETEFVSADVTEAIENVEDKEEDLETRPPIVTDRKSTV